MRRLNQALSRIFDSTRLRNNVISADKSRCEELKGWVRSDACLKEDHEIIFISAHSQSLFNHLNILHYGGHKIYHTDLLVSRMCARC